MLFYLRERNDKQLNEIKRIQGMQMRTGQIFMSSMVSYFTYYYLLNYEKSTLIGSEPTNRLEYPIFIVIIIFISGTMIT